VGGTRPHRRKSEKREELKDEVKRYSKAKIGGKVVEWSSKGGKVTLQYKGGRRTRQNGEGGSSEIREGGVGGEKCQTGKYLYKKRGGMSQGPREKGNLKFRRLGGAEGKQKKKNIECFYGKKGNNLGGGKTMKKEAVKKSRRRGGSSSKGESSGQLKKVCKKGEKKRPGRNGGSKTDKGGGGRFGKGERSSINRKGLNRGSKVISQGKNEYRHKEVVCEKIG